MKKLLIAGILGVGLAVSGCITMPDAKTIMENSYKGHSEIVDLKNNNQDAIFEDSKIWIAKKFVSANNVIQYADKSSGRIIGKGSIALECPEDVKGMTCIAYTSTKAEFTLEIEVKDNKARLTFSDIHQAVNNYPIYDEKSKKVLDGQLKRLVQDYKQTIMNSGNTSDW